MNLLKIVTAAFSDAAAEKHKEALTKRLKEDTGHKQFSSRIEQQPGNTFHEKVINHIVSHDPTPNKKYKHWLVNQYLNHGIKHIEDLPRAHEALKTHNRLAGKKPDVHPDIQHYKGLTHLESATDQYSKHSKKEVDHLKEKELIDNGHATVHHDSKDYKVVTPHTTEASRHFGRNTKWCTTAKDDKDNMFDHYHKQGPLHYLLHKPTGKKWAVHTKKDRSVNVYDEKDDKVDPKHFEHAHVLDHVKDKSFDDLHKKQLGLKYSESKAGRALDRMVNGKNVDKRASAAEVGDDKHRDHLMYDDHREVRREVAKHGNDKHRDHLMKDKDWLVRKEVARYGNDKHRDHLMKDNNIQVRRVVAEHGNDKHRDHLLNDPDEYVRGAVAKYGNDKHRDHLLNDEDYEVRQAVARYGNDKHRDHLMNDADEYVREVAANR